MSVPLGAYGFTIVVYVISIMIAISGISLAIGYAINDKRFKEFGKSELYQSIFNGILVGGLILLFSSGGVVSNLIYSLTIVNGTGMSCSSFLAGNPAICLAYNYLAGTDSYTFAGVQHQSILTMSTTMLTSLFSLDAILGVIAAFKINLFIITISFNYVIVPIINEIQYIIKILSTIAIGAVVQASVLVFVAAGTLSLILPTGLILRAFYPTRKLGGFLIALGIGLYVVLPLSYVFNILLVNSYASNLSSPNIEEVSVAASNAEGSLFSVSSTNSSSVASSISNRLSGLVSSVSNAFSSIINDMMLTLAYFIVYTFVLPAFSLIITGISIRELAELLGAEVSFGRFEMVI